MHSLPDSVIGPRRAGFRLFIVPLVFCLAFAFGLRAGEDAGESPGPTRITDLNGKRIGVIAGTMLDIAANDGLDFTQVFYYDTAESQYQALLAGEIDAILDDEPVVRYLSSKHPQVRRLEGSLQEDDYGYALRYGDGALYDAVDGALREFLEDGTVLALEKKWLDSPDDSLRVMADEPVDESLPLLRMGTSTVSAPFSYLGDDGQVIGLDIELMGLVARRIGRRLVVTNMEFSGLFPSLLDGKVDVIGSCLSITEERRKISRFTTSYHRGGVEALVLVAPEGAPE